MDSGRGDQHMEESLKEFKWRIRRLTGRSWGVSMSYRMAKLAEYLRGWMDDSGLSEYYRPIPELDSLLRVCILMRISKSASIEKWRHGASLSHDTRVFCLISCDIFVLSWLFAVFERTAAMQVDNE